LPAIRRTVHTSDQRRDLPPRSRGSRRSYREHPISTRVRSLPV